MLTNKLFKILVLGLFLLLNISSFAQDNVKLNVESNASVVSNKNLLDFTVSVINDSEESFNGSLQVLLPDGYKNISSSNFILSLNKKESVFLPIKLIKSSKIKAGLSEIIVNVLDDRNNIVVSKKIENLTNENHNLKLSPESSTVFVTNANDSLSIKVNVANLGNIKQNVFVVFSIPELMGEVNFFELNGMVDVRNDTTFNFKFMLPHSLEKLSQFRVNIVGMRGTEKVLFGNTSVVVQNVFSVKRFQYAESFLYDKLYSKNSLTTSYRSVGNNIGTYQLVGTADIDLSAGYLSVNGNYYKTNNQKALITNSYLEYHLNNNKFKFGNVSSLTDMPLFGRGVQFKTQSKNLDNSFEIGFVDENFNLFEEDAFFKNNYGVFVTGVIGNNDPTKRLLGNYIYKKDVIEKAQHHLVGFEKYKKINENWQGSYKLYSGITDYDYNKNVKSVYSIDTRYNGVFNDFRIAGDYFISSNYFPGNRRGTIQLNQSFTKDVFKKSVWFSNVNYSDFSPKSYVYETQMQTNNLRFNTGVTFPRLNTLGVNVEYVYVNEKSNSFKDITENGVLRMSSHRLLGNFNWISKNQYHQLSFGIEQGATIFSEEQKFAPQLKVNSMYHFKGLSATAMYQSGSFYLTEYATMVRFADKAERFERYMFSVSVDKYILKNSLSVKSGVSYISDLYLGPNQSAYINLKYDKNSKFHLFLNSSLYHYKSSNVSISQNKMYIIEGGFTYNFSGRKPSSERKGALKGVIFYDKNSNNIYDEGDVLAKDFFVTIDKTTFNSNELGEFQYSFLPYGNYKMQPIIQNGWFNNGMNIILSSKQQKLYIPLQQSGSVSGKIEYEFDPKKIVDANLKFSGITFNVFKDGKFVQKITTDEDGVFVSFLPTGEYQIVLNHNSLPSNAISKISAFDFEVVAGRITHLPKLVLAVKEKTINVKKFSS